MLAGKFSAGEIRKESFSGIALSPKKFAGNTSKKGNFVTRLTSSVYIINAKQ
jgi:hypothetical protein